MPRHKVRARDTVDAGDGWSTIPGKNRSPLRLPLSDQLSRLSLTPPPPRSNPHSIRTPSPTPVDPIQLAALASSLASARTSLPRRLLTQILAAAHTPAPPRRILVLGLGSLVSATSSSSLLQLALVSEMASAGASETEFVDPAFTGVDAAFLGGLENAVVGDGGDLAVPDVLVAPHLDFDVLAGYLAAWEHLPRCVLANDLRAFVELRVGAEEESKVFKGLLGDAYAEEVIEVERGSEGVGRAFNDLAVYWRKDAGDAKIETVTEVETVVVEATAEG